MCVDSMAADRKTKQNCNEFHSKLRTNGRQTPFFTSQQSFFFLCIMYVCCFAALFSTDETCITIATSNETKFNFAGRKRPGFSFGATEHFNIILMNRNSSCVSVYIKRGETNYV